MEKLKNIWKIVYQYIKSHTVMYVFILTSLICSILVRYYTIVNVFATKPLFTDLSFLLVVAYIGHFFSKRNQFKYFFIWSIILVFICTVNTIYYSNYISFTSVSFLKTATELTGYTDAVLDNILEPKQFIYIFQLVIMIFTYMQVRKTDEYQKELLNKTKKKKKSKKVRKHIIAVEIVLCTCSVIFLTTMITTNGIKRLYQQWNRNSIVRDFGIYVYQMNDLISSVKTQVNSMIGYDSAYKEFRDFYENRDNTKSDNMYTDLFKGKNVIVIHGESIQGFTMNLKFNGEELTPNLNKMAREGIYFDNYYSQESVGNSSDTEFTSLSSLLPATSGTVFTNYFNRNYETILKLLKDKGYYTFSMHGNNGSAWNRQVTYKYLGYDDFYFYTKDYEIDEKIGLGLSDMSFFRQSVDIIKKINDEHENYYGTLVMLSNHTPFSNNAKFEYNVDLVDGEEVIPFLEGTKVGNYLKSVNYADSAIGYLFELLEENDLLDDTVIVLYGDHDAKLKKSELNKLYESEYYEDVLINKNLKLENLDEFTYELNRKVPFIIWSKDIIDTKYNKTVSEVTGMIDMMPTLANMFGVTPKYALGHDMFSIEDNIVVFPSGNWLTDKMYYNNSKGEYRQLDLNQSITIDEIETNNEYAEKLIKISNGIITYDLIKSYESQKEEEKNEQTNSKKG